jgi:RNA polymerase sigma factor (sigma-70 family)
MIRRAYGAAFSDDEIDDVYSSAWLGTLRALERRHANLGDEEIRSYLLTAVANHASKELRRRRRKPIAPLEAAGSVADGTATPEDSAAAEESSRVTRDLLASLPPRRRAVMLLRYGWGLDPAEVCGLVKGLSPRAYRKEITKGVDELTRKIKLVEEGRWCAEREPLLKAYAAGLADGDQELQVRQHLAHCRHCHEFVGKLTGHLHDLGAAVLMPSALEAVNGDSTLFERLGEIAERARDGAIGGASRPEASDALATVASARGAGVAGAGVIAKIAGLGTAGKLVLACIGGGAAVTACVAAGIGPVTVGGDEKQAKIEHVVRAVKADPPRDLEPATTGAPKPTAPPPDRAEEQRDDTEQEAATQTAPVIDPDTPPQEQEFGIAAAATPAPSAPPEASGSGGGGGTSAAVQQEFGP